MIDLGIAAARRAARYQDLAEALDAGVPLPAALAAGQRGAAPPPPPLPGHGTDSETLQALEAAWGRLPELDRAVFEAGVLAGELPGALRERADAWQATSAAQRELLARLAYPALVVVAAALTIAWLMFLGLGVPRGLLVGWSVVVTALGGGALWLRHRTRHDPAFDATRLPLFVGRWVHDIGVAPYFEAFGALLGAGVRIDHAHATASRAAGTAHRRALLSAATAALRSGRGYTEALAGALSDDALQTLAAAETAGNLDTAAKRLAGRHRERQQRGALNAARVLGSLAFVLVAVLVGGIAVSFYADRFAMLRPR